MPSPYQNIITNTSLYRFHIGRAPAQTVAGPSVRDGRPSPCALSRCAPRSTPSAAVDRDLRPEPGEPPVTTPDGYAREGSESEDERHDHTRREQAAGGCSTTTAWRAWQRCVAQRLSV